MPSIVLCVVFNASSWLPYLDTHSASQSKNKKKERSRKSVRVLIIIHLVYQCKVAGNLQFVYPYLRPSIIPCLVIRVPLSLSVSFLPLLLSAGNHSSAQKVLSQSLVRAGNCMHLMRRRDFFIAAKLCGAYTNLEDARCKVSRDVSSSTLPT